jgi:hypothetical protein
LYALTLCVTTKKVNQLGKNPFITVKFQHNYFTVYTIVGLAAVGSLLYRPAAWQLDWPWLTTASASQLIVVKGQRVAVSQPVAEVFLPSQQ